MRGGSWKAVTWEGSGKGATLPLGDGVGMLGQRPWMLAPIAYLGLPQCF